MKTDFGEGLEHVKSIDYNGIEIINTGYLYDAQETVKVPVLDILSGV
jgi:hypothetical protein